MTNENLELLQIKELERRFSLDRRTIAARLKAASIEPADWQGSNGARRYLVTPALIESLNTKASSANGDELDQLKRKKLAVEIELKEKALARKTHNEIADQKCLALYAALRNSARINLAKLICEHIREPVVGTPLQTYTLDQVIATVHAASAQALHDFWHSHTKVLRTFRVPDEVESDPQIAALMQVCLVESGFETGPQPQPEVIEKPEGEKSE